MIRGQKSVRGGIEDFLCPFENFYLTCGANESAPHMGTMASDIRGSQSGLREAYYAPCTVKCVWVYPKSGQAMWQSLNKVRFANGRIDYATFMTVHDDSFNAYVGLVVPQGNQLGNFGTKSEKKDVTGVHCHIQISQSADTTWYKNKYGNYIFNNEYDIEDCFFMENVNIIHGFGNWKYLKDVPVQESYSEGNYVTKFNMKIRSGAGLEYNQVKVKDLTADGKAHATSQDPNVNAVYKEGTVFTAKQIITNGDSVWARSPSGYICIKDSETVYCEKC